MISDKLSKLSNKQKKDNTMWWRKKIRFWLKKIRKNLNSTIFIVELIDEYGVDGDFVSRKLLLF